MLLSNVKKVEGRKQVLGAEVYAPDIPDAHGDYMTAEEIEKMAYGFMKSMNLDQVDVGHDNELYGCHVVESFIARKGDPTFIEGAWVVYIHVPDPELWAKVESGEIGGLSMESFALRKESSIEMHCPVSLIGTTEKADDGHVHKYTVFINEDGEFAGGTTDVVNGHKHDILSGTKTEIAQDHSHKYCYIDVILELEGNYEQEEDQSD